MSSSKVSKVSKVSSSIVSKVSSCSSSVCLRTYVVRMCTNYIISEFKHKNFYLSKYHIIKEYIPHYTKNK